MNDLVKVLLAPPVAYCIDANYYKGTTIQQYLKKKRRQLVMEITMEDEEDMKIVCEQRCDEGIRFFRDDVCGTIRTIDGGGGPDRGYERYYNDWWSSETPISPVGRDLPVCKQCGTDGWRTNAYRDPSRVSGEKAHPARVLAAYGLHRRRLR